ncbi:hypothetical protein QYE76_051005 [Lolium multiflorum]|uniref:Uncharacterized protein n=1 Tax=Lolium multiflorum TaxID=4521 RepID=A0AAD8WIC2_LOLMU|nr:hypothetical protein QYE76_051005 [Lolium multiflorum]
MSRAHPMWLYSGPKDETRVNVAELSEKELLDEVRHLTLFSQEDSIPLISPQPSFDADHLPTEIPTAPESAEKADALPSKISSGGFAYKDDLFDLDEGFIDPLSKKAKTSTSKPDPAASEASTPATALVSQISTASSLSKGKEIPSTAVATTSPPKKPDLRAVISSLEAFASQYTSLETDKARLQKEIESSSSKLEGAIKIAAEARQNVDFLKDELEKLKRKLKDEETSRLAAEDQMNEKDDLLRQSISALLKAADIPAEALDKLPNNSPANALSLTLESHKLVQALLQKIREPWRGCTR